MFSWEKEKLYHRNLSIWTHVEHGTDEMSWKGLPGTFPIALLHVKWAKSGVSQLSLLADLPCHGSFIHNAHKLSIMPTQNKYFAFGRTVFSQICA